MRYPIEHDGFPKKDQEDGIAKWLYLGIWRLSLGPTNDIGTNCQGKEYMLLYAVRLLLLGCSQDNTGHSRSG